MSSLMDAGMYIADSQDKRLCNEVAFNIFSRIIQNILDGIYQNSKNTHLDYFHYKNQQRPPLSVNIVGISLGDTGKNIQIFNKEGISGNIHGVRGDISILYEYYGEIQSINLAEIQSITRKRVWPIVLQGATHEEKMLELLRGTGVSSGTSASEVELV